jgi:lipid II:glycine glycyltransferase (peptidoglycan interpeptide bridge formation enzyme)
MPPFTHVLGPVVYPGSGKPQTQLLRRLSIVRDLIDQLPEHHGFFHALDSASVDGLAFQDRGYHVAPQYTFEIDCRDDPETLWAAMHFKTRQHVRRAEDKFSVATVQDPDEFINFYLENLKKQRLVSYVHWTNFPEVFRQASVRDSGEILCARWADGRPAAMVFLAWGRGKMYYLLSTRAQDAGDNGSVNLLIWSSMKRAHSRGLLFDLDGVSTSGTARFLSGFNGTPKIRHVVRKMSFTYGAMQYAKRQIFGVRRNSSTFT